MSSYLFHLFVLFLLFCLFSPCADIWNRNRFVVCELSLTGKEHSSVIEEVVNFLTYIDKLIEDTIDVIRRGSLNSNKFISAT